MSGAKVVLITGGGTSADYAAPKAGLEGLTHAHASTLRLHRVTTGAAAPALIDSGMVRGMDLPPPGQIPNQVVGTWIMRPAEGERDGVTRPLFGPHPAGVLFFTADMRFGGMIASSPNWSGLDRDTRRITEQVEGHAMIEHLQDPDSPQITIVWQRAR